MGDNVERIDEAVQCNLGAHMDQQSPFFPVDQFERIPTELLIQIFLQLPYDSLKSARLVCRRWYEASILSFDLLDQDQLVIYHGDSLEDISRLAECNRGFFHLKIQKNKSVWLQENGFWLKHGRKLQTLTVKHCSINKDDFFKAIKLCPDLREISIKSCKLISSPEIVNNNAGDDCDVQLPNLVGLRLVGYHCSNYELFHRIVANAPKLVLLTLLNCLGTPYISTPGLQDLKIGHILKYLKDNSNRKFFLGLDFHTDMDEPGLSAEEFVELMQLPNIEPILIKSNHFPRVLYNRSFRRLRSLEIGLSAIEIDDSMLESMCRNFSKLRKLIITWGLSPVTTAVEHLALLKRLTSLHLSGLSEVNEAALLRGLCSKVNYTLSEFRVDDSYRTTSKFFIEFARTHPVLKSFHVFKSTGFDDKALQAVFKYQVFVNELCINHGEASITDASILGAVLNDPVDGGDEPEDPVGYGISNLRELKTLQLKGSQVTVDALNDVFERHPHITNLALDMTPLTDEFVLSLPAKLPHLKTASVFACDGVSPESVDFLRNSNIYVPKLFFVDLDADLDGEDGDGDEDGDGGDDGNEND